MRTFGQLRNCIPFHAESCIRLKGGTVCRLLFVLLAAHCSVPASAQASERMSRFWIETNLGINMFGPAPSMAGIMEEEGFDDESSSFFSDGPIDHPAYPPVGATFQLSLSYRLGLQSRLGLMTQYALLREVRGHDVNAGHLFVRFTNLTFAPVYIYAPGKSWEAKAGPALMINRGNRSDAYSDEPVSDFRKISPGLHLGISVFIWNSTFVYGKLNGDCLLTYRNTMGPYTMEGWDNRDYSLPENDFGFSHVNILFAIGVHF